MTDDEGKDTMTQQWSQKPQVPKKPCSAIINNNSGRNIRYKLKQKKYKMRKYQYLRGTVSFTKRKTTSVKEALLCHHHQQQPDKYTNMQY